MVKGLVKGFDEFYDTYIMKSNLFPKGQKQIMSTPDLWLPYYSFYCPLVFILSLAWANNSV